MNAAMIDVYSTAALKPRVDENASVQSYLRLFRDDLTTLRDVDRGSVHSRGLTCRFGGESEPSPHSSGEAFGPFDTLARFHDCLSNKTGWAPELSYIAQESAMGR